MIRAAAIAVALTGVAATAAAATESTGERPGRALFEQAEAKFNIGRFDEALVDYQAAYAVEPLPAFLFNIGQCYRNMGDYEQAQFFFRRYTTLDPRSPNRPAAERLIAEMQRLASERADNPAPPPALFPPPAAAETAPAAAPAPVVAETSGDRAATRRPIYRRTWFWVAVSAVVVGGVATAFAVAPDDRHSSLRPIDTR